MKVIDIEQGSIEWLEARRGKITGSRLKDIVVKRGTEEKLGFYELIAERIADEMDDENPMERGLRLESDAAKALEELLGKEEGSAKVVGMWVSDKDDRIAISPDRAFSDEEPIEIKCLSNARHLQAWFEKKIPKEYHEQAVQYFIVNEKAKILYFVFYNPFVKQKPIFFLTITREMVAEDIEYLENYQLETLKKVDQKVIEFLGL